MYEQTAFLLDCFINKRALHACRGVEIISQLPDILAHFQHPCPASRILCIQLSFNLLGHTLHLSDNVLHDWLFPHPYMSVGLHRFWPWLILCEKVTTYIYIIVYTLRIRKVHHHHILCKKRLGTGDLAFMS